ncbi:hypothetical protein FQR65_LT20616 [Abscondita terminalis]|nr:hypothetical protein FQR65_LT20616 [Abscondita terminalis]
MAGGPRRILLPEYPESLEQVCDWVMSVRDRGRSSLIVVAEGFKLEGAHEAITREGLDGFGRPRLGGVAEMLAPLIEQRTGIEARATVLGHVQRGGSPTAFDRVLATRTGIAAADAVLAGDWGKMAGLRGDCIEMVPLSDAVGHLKACAEARTQSSSLLRYLCLRGSILMRPKQTDSSSSRQGRRIPALGSASDVILAAANTDNLTAIASYGTTSPFSIFANKSITSLKDLEGKKLLDMSRVELVEGDKPRSDGGDAVPAYAHWFGYASNQPEDAARPRTGVHASFCPQTLGSRAPTM